MDPTRSVSFQDLLTEVDEQWQDTSDEELVEIAMTDLAIMALEDLDLEEALA